MAFQVQFGWCLKKVGARLFTTYFSSICKVGLLTFNVRFSRKLVVDDHIDVALKRKHEVMLSGSFVLESRGPAISAFVVVPLRNEKEVSL